MDWKVGTVACRGRLADAERMRTTVWMQGSGTDRGIKHLKIFRTIENSQKIVKKLGKLAIDTKTGCYNDG